MALIIDTDIGSDIDDCLAIAYAVESEIDVKLITTVHGDTIRRAKIAYHLLDLLGSDIPVAAGSAMPIKQKQIYTIGTEHYYEIGDGQVDPDGVARMIGCINENPGIHIAAIGPMTNIASALLKDQHLYDKIGHIYLMGNAIACTSEYHLNYRSHNLKVDPEAVDIVFAGNIPITIVTTDVCKKNSISREQFKSFTNPALNYIRQNSDRWLESIAYDSAFLYDPLTVHHYIDSDVTEQRVYGNVRITTAMQKSFQDVCLETLLRRTP